MKKLEDIITRIDQLVMDAVETDIENLSTVVKVHDGLMELVESLSDTSSPYLGRIAQAGAEIAMKVVLQEADNPDEALQTTVETASTLQCMVREIINGNVPSSIPIPDGLRLRQDDLFSKPPANPQVTETSPVIEGKEQFVLDDVSAPVNAIVGENLSKELFQPINAIIGENLSKELFQPKSNILIADEMNDGETLADLLSRQGFNVTLLKQGKDIFKRSLEDLPDLFIFSLSLPGINVWDLCWEIQYEKSLKKIPIILSSNTHDIQQRVKALKLGISDFFCKPFDIEEILARIIFLLEKVREEKLRETQRIALEGSIDILPLHEVLYEINLSQRTGRLHILTEKKKGEISFKNGEIAGAQTESIKGKKALLRLLSLDKGKFKFEDGKSDEDCSIQMGFNPLMQESMNYKSEFERLNRVFPDFGSRLVMRFSKEFFEWGLNESTPIQRDLLSLIYEHQTLDQLLDNTSWDDITVLKECQKMCQKGLLDTAKTGEKLTFLKEEKTQPSEKSQDIAKSPLKEGILTQEEASSTNVSQESRNVQVEDYTPLEDQKSTTIEETKIQESSENLEKDAEVAPVPSLEQKESQERAEQEKPSDFSGKWNVRLKQDGIPVDISFVILQLEQKDVFVTGMFLRRSLIGRPGTYKGTLEGIVGGKNLTVTWKDSARDGGKGEFSLLDGNQKMEGKWSTSTPEASGTWSANRA